MLLINAVNAAGRPVELFVKDGKIAAVGQDLSALAGEGETVLDAGGLTVLPAFVDLHCHWRTPGFEYKEDIATGSMAAAAGGYTFVNLMPNTKPVCSSAAQAAMVEQKAAEVGLCDVNQTVSITENFDGKTIDHLKTLPASVKFITEDGHGVQDNATMARAFAICTQRDFTVMSHAEDMEISPWDYRLAEDLETVRNCWLSEYYQTRLHMCHVSTRGALEAIQMAKLRGAPVTCEVTPHHLWFNNETCDYRVNPPIRTADDVQALDSQALDEQAQRLDCDKERLPACKSDRIHIFRKKFRKHRAEEIRRNRYEIVERAVKASLAELHRKQNEVCGLRVAEHSALQCEGIRAEKSADRDHHQIHAKLFRLGKFLFAQNYIIFSHFVHLHFCMFFVSILSFQAPFVKLIVRFSDKYAVCERRKFIFGFCSASGFEKAVNIFSFSS